MWLSGRALALHAQDPEFDPQHHKKRKRIEGREINAGCQENTWKPLTGGRKMENIWIRIKERKPK